MDSQDPLLVYFFCYTNRQCDTIKELVEKKLRKIKNRSDFEKKQLVSRYLYSKGYEPEKFISIINKKF